MIKLINIFFWILWWCVPDLKMSDFSWYSFYILFWILNIIFNKGLLPTRSYKLQVLIEPGFLASLSVNVCVFVCVHVHTHARMHRGWWNNRSEKDEEIKWDSFSRISSTLYTCVEHKERLNRTLHCHVAPSGDVESRSHMGKFPSFIRLRKIFHNMPIG